MDEWPPPWIAIPEMQPYDPATQGKADWYINQIWLPFWKLLTPEGKAEYLDRWEASPRWRKAIAYLYDGDNDIDWEEEARFDAEWRAVNVDNVPPRRWWQRRRRASKAELQKRIDRLIAEYADSAPEDAGSAEPIGSAGEMNDTPPPAELPDVLAFDATVTLEDLLALQMRCLRSSAMQAGRPKRLATTAMIGVAFAPLALVGGTLIGWIETSHRMSLGSLLHFLVLEEPGTLLKVVLGMVVCTVGGALVQEWLLRPRLRRVLRRILRARPDVDPSDPLLGYTARVTLSDEGLESRTATGVTLLRWDVLKRWEEADGLVMVLGDAMVGFCVRISAVDPRTTRQLRAFLAARLGPVSE